MEGEVLLIGKAMDMKLNIPASKICGQLAGKHRCIAACNIDIARVLGLQASQGMFKTLYILHLIDKKVVSDIGVEARNDICRQIFTGSYCRKFFVFFIDKDDVRIRS